MDNLSFYNSFAFVRISLTRAHHTNNSHGAASHFVGRIRKGTARIVADSGEELRLGVGDLFYLPLGLRYNSYWYPNEQGELEWDSYRFDFFSCRSGREYTMQIMKPSEATLRYFDAIDPSLGVTNFSIGMLFAFLGECFYEMEAKEDKGERKLFSRAKEYILAHPKLRVSELARYLGMSESAVYSFFRSYAGVSPVELKNKLLAERAAALLSSTDLSVEEIAEKVGLGSAVYMRRVLDRYLGKSPRCLRKREIKS